MPTIDDIATAALRRLEEDTVSPVFWNYPEMRSLVLEALCEAILITGSPQVRITSAPYTLIANQTFQPAPQVVFANHSVLAIVRIEGTGNLALHKCSLFDLDMDNKDWRNDAPTAVPRDWFPFGLGGVFGIHPQVVAPVQVVLTAIEYPIITSPPFGGGEPINFQSEFNLGFEAYVAHAARIKEGGAEADAGMPLYELFLSVATELSKFQLRKDSLRFSRTMGPLGELNEVETK